MAGELIEHLEERKSNRRNFVQKLGMAGVAAGVVSALTPSQLQADPTTPTDADILNFALNLEFLEAEFYTVATTGQNISQFGIIDYGTGTTGGTTTGGSQVNFTDRNTQQLALELASNEREHVALLQTALAGMGGSIAKPQINLNALGFGFGSQADFLKLSRIFEDVGVSAYGGAAGSITSKAVLADAARILAVEAYHSGAIRMLMAQQGVTSAALDGADVLPPPSGVRYGATNGLALSPIRTPAQVLFLAYGGAASATKGGFFPAGVNGNLVTAAAAGATPDVAVFTATPNPIAANGATYVATTVTWSAPAPVSSVAVYVGSLNGPLFAEGGATGSAATGNWVTDGMTFYLQDISNGNPVIPQYTLATLTIRFS